MRGTARQFHQERRAFEVVQPYPAHDRPFVPGRFAGHGPQLVRVLGHDALGECVDGAGESRGVDAEDRAEFLVGGDDAAAEVPVEAADPYGADGGSGGLGVGSVDDDRLPSHSTGVPVSWSSPRSAPSRRPASVMPAAVGFADRLPRGGGAQRHEYPESIVAAGDRGVERAEREGQARP